MEVVPHRIYESQALKRSLQKSSKMALFTSSAMHCLAVLPDGRQTQSGTQMTLPAQTFGNEDSQSALVGPLDQALVLVPSQSSTLLNFCSESPLTGSELQQAV